MFKVIALSVGGVGNQIFHSGDKVKEDSFHPGTIPSLIKGGYIVAIADESVVADLLSSEGKLDEEEGKDEGSKQEDLKTPADAKVSEPVATSQEDLNKLLGKPEPAKTEPAQTKPKN